MEYLENGLEIYLYLVLGTDQDGNDVFYAFDTKMELEEYRPVVEPKTEAIDANKTRSFRRSSPRLVSLKMLGGASSLKIGRCSTYELRGGYYNGLWVTYKKIEGRWSFNPNLLQVSPFYGGAEVCARGNGWRITSLIASRKGGSLGILLAKRSIEIRP
jgi:hypothetical protein